MALTYTTTEAIALRLKGRLQLAGTPTPFGNTVADPALIEQVGTQVEARVNGVLRGVYRFPLRSVAHPELSSVVEKLVCCELLPIYYYGMENSTDGGQGRLMCDQGKAELAALASGQTVLLGEALLGQEEYNSFTEVGRRGQSKPAPPSYCPVYPTKVGYSNGWTARPVSNADSGRAEEVRW